MGGGPTFGRSLRAEFGFEDDYVNLNHGTIHLYLRAHLPFADRPLHRRVLRLVRIAPQRRSSSYGSVL